MRPIVAHPYHLVEVSPWPFLMSMAMFSFAYGVVSLLMGYPTQPLTYIPSIALILFLWWRDVIREAYAGYHTTIVQRGI